MTRTHPRGIALLLCSLLAVTACTPDEPAPEEPAGTAAATEAPVDTEVGPATAPGRATMTEDAAARRLVPVSCGDLPRAPTEQEEDWLVEPGPYSGDAFDQTAAVAGVRPSRRGRTRSTRTPSSP